MLAAGWVLFAVGMWLFGQRGLGFDQPPDLGRNRWLIVALLCLATVLSARWAVRRLNTRGGDPASLWCLVPRPPDGGRDYAPEDRATRTLLIVAGVLGFLLCLGTGLALGEFSDRLGRGWSLLLISGLIGAMILSLCTWGRRRIAARIPADHRVKPVSDPTATATAVAASLLGVATCWTAGLTGVPATIEAAWLGNAASLTCSAGFIATSVGAFRLRALARRQAASAVKEHVPAPA